MHRRSEFKAETKRDAFARSRGICECHRIPWLRRPRGCGVRLVSGSIFYEHVNTDFHSGDNGLDNCATLSRTCWREKTARYDIPSIAKTKRIRDLARGIKREPKGRPLNGTVASGIKLHLNAPPTWRDSGRPLWKARR
jgi:hypothetical protein